MNFSHFKNKLFIWAIFPVLGIAVFSFLSINHSLNTVKHNESTIDIVKLSFLNNALVHELQKERGMSNVYLSSKGKEFSNELTKQRKASDLVIFQQKIYHEKISKLTLQQNNLLQLNGIEILAIFRNKVDTLSATSTQTLGYYSKLTSQLIDTILSATALNASANINNLLHAYYNLVMSKEFSGIERALLADIISADGFSQATISAVNQVRAKEEVHLALFNKLANKKLRQFYQQAMIGKSINEMQLLRNTKLNEIASKSWFDDATTRINQLQQVEAKIVDSLILTLEELNLQATKELMFSSVYGFLSVLLTALLFIRIFFQFSEEQKYKQLLIRQKEVLDQFKVIVDNTLNSVVITDPHGVIEYVNKRFSTISGYEPLDVIGDKPKLWSSGQTTPEVYAEIFQTLKQGGYWQGELKNKRKNGEMYWAKTTMFPVKSSQKEITQFICIQEDITQQKNDKDTIEHLANHDALTGLPSLRLGKDRLEQAILAAQRHNLTAAVMFIDLDGFKQINDKHGHDAGDYVLIEVGRRIVKELRKTDTVARIGGDEFIVVMTNIKHTRAISQVAMKIIDSVKAEISYLNNPLNVTASIGISKYPFHGTTSSELMKKADIAMYQIKHTGKNNYAIYSDISE